MTLSDLCQVLRATGRRGVVSEVGHCLIAVRVPAWRVAAVRSALHSCLPLGMRCDVGRLTWWEHLTVWRVLHGPSAGV